MLLDKEKLSKRGLDSIIINRSDLDNLYSLIGCGVEGCVYNYQDVYALKHLALFRAIECYYKIKFDRKIEKIRELAKLEDEAFCFPIGLFGFEDLFIEGYYMNLIKSRNKSNFSILGSIDDKETVRQYLAIADKAMKRAHLLGIKIGDIKEENILIDDDGKVYFIDTDNYAYHDIDFDLFPYRAGTMKRIYRRDFDLVDNDKFIYTLMALKIITGNPLFTSSLLDDEMIELLIDELALDKETKGGLRLILSDSTNKPYFSEVYVKKI